MIAVILAGGRGTRLWPMSRRQKPKQFYEIISDNPMIVDVYNRLKERFDAEDIYISTQPEFKDLISQLFPTVADDKFILEPHKRDTGPAYAFIAQRLKNEGRGDEPVALIPTDHYIDNVPRFLDSLHVAEKLINETGKMLDISVVPNFPSTILGYTQIGEKYGEFKGIDVFNFKGHKEKPDQATALSYVQSGNYLWHASYYMWTPNNFLEAYKSYAPEIYEKLDDYENMPSISIDYAVTEKMNPEDVLIIRGDFGWSDIGAWDVLHDRLKHQDELGNVTRGEVIGLDTNNCLLYTKPGKIMAVLGVSDLVVVDTEDALLICPQSRSQEVKKIVKRLEDEGKLTFL